ncbi:MAG: hypothetical protein KY464_12425 [Gemmatimonadetes bacterium]|nr:hypothetical protein [Gemmatimonadota bacterium]
MEFKEATDLLSVPLDRIAAAVGKTYGTVLAYRTGDRVPPAEVRIRLAAFMREHSAALLEAADSLDGSR